MELSACIVVYNGADEALRAAQTVLGCTRRLPEADGGGVDNR